VSSDQLFELNRFGPGLSSRARFWLEMLIELGTIHMEQEPLEIIGETPAQVYAGDVTYRTKRGWTFVIFNDCNSWDYIEDVIAPDGRQFSKEWPGDPGYVEGVFGGTVYVPSPEELVKVWGFPVEDFGGKCRI
jgi:hypothetical protein